MLRRTTWVRSWARLGYPRANDTNDASEAGEATVAVEIEGVSPEVAVAVTYSKDVIFIREDYPFESLPGGAKRLLTQ